MSSQSLGDLKAQIRTICRHPVVNDDMYWRDLFVCQTCGASAYGENAVIPYGGTFKGCDACKGVGVIPGQPCPICLGHSKGGDTAYNREHNWCGSCKCSGVVDSNRCEACLGRGWVAL